MTKLYRFTQTLNNYIEHYYQMEGTLEDIIHKWLHHDNITEYLWWCGISCYEELHSNVLGFLNKQKVYIEVVDDSVYGLGWRTKIEEIES